MPLISTTGDLVTFVLRASGINGIGQTPSAEDSNTGLQMLVNLIAQWQKKRWLTYVEEEVSLTSTGAQSYTIGPGMDFDCARPNQIKAAYFRILGQGGPNRVDLPLVVIPSREDYSRITIKDLVSVPGGVFYESGYPTGNVYFIPVPPAATYGLHLVVQSPLPRYNTLTDPIALPDEYMEALIWSLCVRMQMAYGIPARPDQVAAMTQAMNTLRQANAQIAVLPIPVPHGRWNDDASSFVGVGTGRAFILDSGSGALA